MSLKRRQEAVFSDRLASMVRSKIKGVLCLGLLWVYFCWASGIVYADKAFYSDVERMAPYVSVSLVFILFAFQSRPYARAGYRAQVLGGAVGCCALVPLYVLGGPDAPGPVLLAGILLGPFYALLFRAWLCRYRAPFGIALVTTLLASAVARLAELAPAALSTDVGPVLATVGLLGAATLLYSDGRTALSSTASSGRGTRWAGPAGVVLTFAGMAAANTAGNLLLQGVAEGGGMASFCPLAVIMALVFVLLWRNGLAAYPLFFVLSLALCLSAFLSFLPIANQALIQGIVSGAVHPLFALSVAWSISLSVERPGVCDWGLLGMGLTFFSSTLCFTLGALSFGREVSLILCGLLLSVGVCLFSLGCRGGEGACTNNVVFAGGAGVCCEALPSLEDLAERHGLSDREMRLIELFARGSTVQDAAAELQLSISSIKHCRSVAYKKLSVSSREELLSLLGEQGEPVEKVR